MNHIQSYNERHRSIFLSLSLLLSIHQHPYQGTDADDGEGIYLLEIKGKEGYDADDEAFPIDEVFGCGKGEGCGADKS